MKRKNAAPMSLNKLTLSVSLVFSFAFAQAQEAGLDQEPIPVSEAAKEQIDSLSALASEPLV